MGPTTSDGARLFFLAGEPTGAPELLPEEARHAVQVLRVGVGERLLGTLGQGRAWPLRVRSVARSGLRLELDGPPLDEPPPGAPGARLPWIEVASPMPQGARGEAMLERLVQLGLAAWTPLASARVQGPRRELSEGKRRRMLRTAREGLKQCRRLWLPRLDGPCELEDLERRARSAELICLDPRAEVGVLRVARDVAGPEATWGSEARPWILAVGPEGGWTPTEVERLAAAGAHRARLGPYVLRIETAAEAALACVVAEFQESGRSAGIP